MSRFVLRRVLMLIPVLLGVSFFIFFVLRLGDTDPARAYLRLSGLPPTQELLENTRIALGLHEPLWHQYVQWLWKALHGDMGVSYVTGKPVLDEVLYYLPATLELAVGAMLVTLFVGIPLGFVGALYRDRWPDHVIRLFAFGAVSMPSFWLGFLLILFFAQYLQIFPAMGRSGLMSGILPVMTLSLMCIGIHARLVRAAVLEHIHSRSMTYARVRGVRGWRLWLHSARAMCIPILTATSMHFGEMLGGTVLVESIFNWPGLGRFLISALNNHDYPVIQCFTLVMTCIVVLLNAAVDILSAFADPRIRMGEEGVYGVKVL